MKKFLSAALLALLCAAGVTSCSNDDDAPALPIPVGDLDFRCAAPASMNWQTGDRIGLYATLAGNPLDAAGSVLQNLCLTYGEDGAWHCAGGAAIEADALVDFYAYYPYAADAADPARIAFEVGTAQDEEEAWRASGLMTAQATGVAAGAAVALEFAHALVQVEVTAQDSGLKGYELDEQMQVRLVGVACGGTLNLADGSFAAAAPGDDDAGIVMKKDDEGFIYRAWVPAQEVAAGQELLALRAPSGQTMNDVLLTEALVIGAETPVRLACTPRLIRTVAIPAGTFMMGSPEDEEGRDKDEPLHQVTLTRNFHMGVYEVTNAQYAEFLNAVGVGEDRTYETESNGEQALLRAFSSDALKWVDGKWVPEEGRENGPVMQVSWFGAYEYAKWVGGQLPTEAQWEYACRAGTQTAWSFGDDPSVIGDYAWCWASFESPVVVPEGVGMKLPNPWGLYDMHGSAFEWCLDNRSGELGPEDSDPVTDPISPHPGRYYLLRGGSCLKLPSSCRSAVRYSSVPRLCEHGLRVIFEEE